MTKEILDSMIDEDELTARVVIDDFSLRRSTERVLLKNLNNKEVLIHRETAQPIPAVQSIRVKVSLKESPAVSSFILSKFLDPLSEKTREFLSEKNFL